MRKLLALAALAVSAQVSAQSTVQFNGTVSTNCTLSVTRNGTLTVSPATPYTMVTESGSEGLVSVSYTGTPTVNVSLPTAFTSSPTLGFTPLFSGTVFSSSIGNVTVTNNEAAVNYTTGSSDSLTVALGIGTGSSTPFPTGNYNATATVTCS